MHLRSSIVGALALACSIVVAPPAQARHVRHHVVHVVHHRAASSAAPACAGKVYDNDGRTHCGGAMADFSSLIVLSARHAVDFARPHDCYGIAWCGCWLRHYFGIADRALNLARNWARWGHAASPGAGVVVVWPHHVGLITGRASNGQWIVKSGNDGHAVRERPRSIAGAIAFRAS